MSFKDDSASGLLGIPPDVSNKSKFSVKTKTAQTETFCLRYVYSMSVYVIDSISIYLKSPSYISVRRSSIALQL